MDDFADTMSSDGTTRFLGALKIELSESCFLNNFHCAMPGGFYRDPHLFKAAFRKGESFIQAMSRAAHENGEVLKEKEVEEYSAKKLAQTPAQFFHTIDSALEKCDIKPHELEVQLRRLESRSLTHCERNRIIHDIHETLLPVYILLRMHGYSHRDLTG